MEETFLYDTVKEIKEISYFINHHLYKKYNTLIDENMTVAQNHLLTIIHTSEPITISEIAEKLTVSSSAASQQVSKLEENGYVKRQINPKNRREILVRLDTKGIDFINKQEKMDAIVTEKLYAKLGKEKLTEYKNILLQLKEITLHEFP